jgi:NADH:ubiquinone reductase (H+-translocating)
MAGIDRSGATVLVVGGGFAGVACAKELAKHDVRVTLIDQNNYHQFQPMLYQVATAQVASSDVVRPLRGIFRKRRSVGVKMATVTEVDARAKTVTCADGASFSGDYLVLAMGSRPNFFGTPGAEAHAFPLYSLADAQRLRSRVFAVFEDADRNPKLIDQGALNFVIVGAGATGVETAGSLTDLINDVMPVRFHELDTSVARVYVIDPAPVVLAPFSERAQSYAAKVLEKKGAKLLLGVKVSDVKADRVVLSDGREILTRSVVWAGGIQGSELATKTGIAGGRGGRLDVGADLTVDGFPGVYALGDVANTVGPDGKAFPQLGSVALQAGTWAARNILADIEGRPRSPFAYRDKGIMAMIGHNAAIAAVGPRRREVHGLLAFLSWLGVHAWLLEGYRERANAVRSWAWTNLSKSRAPSIIDRADAAQIDWGLGPGESSPRPTGTPSG